MHHRFRAGWRTRHRTARRGVPRSTDSPIRRTSEVGPEQCLRTTQAIFRKDHRLRPADRVQDHPLFVQSRQRIPVEALPGAALVMKRQREQRQNRVVDLVCVELNNLNRAKEKAECARSLMNTIPSVDSFIVGEETYGF